MTLLVVCGPPLEMAAQGFVSPGFAARTIGRPERTVREWMRRGDVGRVECYGNVYVNVRECARQSATRGRRVRLPRADQAA